MPFSLPGLPAGAALAWLIAAAFASGLARGFSGFGAALIFVPLAAVALGPQRAAPLMLLVDMVAVIAITPKAWRTADRREVGWLAVGLAFGTPLGIAALRVIDPLTLRWAVSLGIFGLLALLVSGWHFRARPVRPVTVGFGLVGGFLGGVAMMSGPAAMTYLLGRSDDSKQIRADFALYLAAGALFAAIGFSLAGLIGRDLIGPFALAAPAYALGTWGGTRMFGLASNLTFRLACYGMIALAALLALPAWDGVLR